MSQKETTHRRKSRAILIQPGGGRVHQAFGDAVTVKLGGADTNGMMMVAIAVTPPGGGPPPHVHHHEDEVFVVLEGRVSFLAHGEWTELPPGGLAYLPRDVPHTFQNRGDQPCRMLIITQPAGFEQFFAKASSLFAGPQAPAMEKIVETAKAFGIEFVATA